MGGGWYKIGRGETEKQSNSNRLAVNTIEWNKSLKKAEAHTRLYNQ